MPVQILVLPTLKAYQGTHLVPPQLERVPVVAETGDGDIERLFCKTAHDAARGHEFSTCNCTHWQRGMCGLTGHRSRCLLNAPDDPLWAIIRQSVEIEKQHMN